METSPDPSIVHSMEQLNVNVSTSSQSDQTRDFTTNTANRSVQTQTLDSSDLQFVSPLKTARFTAVRTKSITKTNSNANSRIDAASNKITKPPPKRKREDSSAESLTYSISDSTECIVTKPVTKHVTFLQNSNPKNGGATSKQSTSTSDNHDQYEVLKSAAPIWHLALQHKTYEQRANMRATALKDKIDNNSPPLWCFGIEKMPEYLNPISEELFDMMQRHAMEIAEHCYLKLLEKQINEQGIGNSHMNLTKHLYEEENNPDFPKAEARLVGIIAAYRAQEKQKIGNIYSRDEAKRPADKAGWLQALANRSLMLQPRPTPSTSGNNSGSGNYTRRRSSSGNRRRAPSTRRPRRERSRTPERRRRPAYTNQRSRPNRVQTPPETPGHQALVEALRSLLNN